ncbi:phage tail protein [Xenorhabdus bovienii]|uniref:phage tail protein n=1 Tax=Xenorhabdus bovienii TaxID=40576 RepID=UPI003B9797C3
MTKTFKTPFAAQGDRVSIPNEVQPDGSVSYTQGYGYDYERDQNTDPAAKDIEREKMNGMFHDITEAVGEIQTFGVAQWTIEAQPYPLRALVYHNQKLYQSRIENNKEDPQAGKGWVELKADLTAADVGAYNQEEANQRFQPLGNYTPAGYSYNKEESDNRFQPKGNYQLVGNYALKGESYTKPESDGKYQPMGNYLVAGYSYSKDESDTRYQPKGNYAPAGNYALKGESYTKGDSDSKYQPKGNYQPTGATMPFVEKVTRKGNQMANTSLVGITSLQGITNQPETINQLGIMRLGGNVIPEMNQTVGTNSKVRESIPVRCSQGTGVSGVMRILLKM